MNTAVLCAYWHKRPLSALQYAESLKAYVACLEQLSSAFSRMYVLGKSKADTARLEPSSENLQQLVLAGLPKDWSYLSAEGKKIPASLESYTRNGFANALATTLDHETEGAVVETVMGSIDAEEISNVIVRLRGPELTGAAFLRRLFAHTVELWRPAYAYLEVEGPGTAQNNANLDEIPLGWLTYIAGEKPLASVPSGVHPTRCGPGVLIEVTGGDAPGQHAQYNERLRDLRESLRFAGLLTDPLASY